MDPGRVRAELVARFGRSVAGASVDWPLSLPPALRESMVAAAILDGGACPESLADYYTRAMPSALLSQLDRSPGRSFDSARALLWRPLSLLRMPKLEEALDGLFAQAEIDAATLCGAPSVAELIAARPTVMALYSPTLFASGLPLLGAWPAELATIADDLASGADPDAVIDRRLSGNLVHELCHGPRRELDVEAAPWIVLEAAAIHLGLAARAAHVFPDEPGEAVPFGSLFVLLGEGLARRFGRGALWRLSTGESIELAFGNRAARALTTAEWQSWLARRTPPFAPDALRAIDWLKLAEAAGGSSTPSLSEAIDRADPRGPDLLGAAAAVPWRALPWWSEEPQPLDRTMAKTAVRALFQINRLSPTAQTDPDEAPGGRLFLDVETCVMTAATREAGAFAEPAHWLFPPPLARKLAARGARRIVIEGATRSAMTKIADALLALCDETAALSTEKTLDLRGRGTRTPDVFAEVAQGRALWDAALVAAHRLGLFAALTDGDRTAAELAQALGVAPRRLRALLDALAVDGVLLRHGDRFTAARVAPSPAIADRGWGRLAEAIRADCPLEENDDDDSQRRFHHHLADVGRPAARALATRLAEDLGSGALLDVGGGAGTYAAALLDAAPDSRATLVDRAPVIDLARAALAAYGTRVRFVAADFEQAILDGDFRIALLCNVLHLHPPETCAQLVDRAARALAPGGQLVVKDLAIAEDRSRPRESVLFALNMALYTDGGDVHHARTIAGWLHRAGLDEITVDALGEASVVVTGKRW